MGTVQIDGSTPKITVGNATAEDATILFDGNAQDFYIALDDSADDLLIGLGSTVGTTPIIAIDENKLSTFSGAITVGVDDTGHDVKLFGATAGSFLLWDESADALLLTDSTPIQIGDAQDLTLYHDGTNSYITNKTGALKIATESSGIALTIGHTTSEVTIGDNLTTTGTLTVGSTVINTNGYAGMLDSWRFTTNATDDVDPFSANLERNDTAGFSHLVGMSNSSGIWTFPSTGFYLVTMSIAFDEEGGGAQAGIRVEIEVTTDNSSYNSHGVGYINFDSSGQGQGIASSIIDVTDTANVKVKFKTVGLDSSNRVIGNSTQDLTSFKFIRLGDT